MGLAHGWKSGRRGSAERCQWLVVKSGERSGLGAAGEPKQGQAGIKRLRDPVTRGTAVEKATGWSPAYSLLMHRRLPVASQRQRR